jgi:SAM-dependent methyltransferase
MDSHAWDERYAGTELVWSRGPNQFVEQRLADLPPGRAVDLACGEGRNAIWLAGRGWRVHGVDFSQVAVDKGRTLAEHAGVEVAWARGDATSWQPPEPVDLVVVAYLQLPAADRRAAARNAVRMLAPGGTLLWVAHDSTNLAEGTGGPQDPAVLMTAEDVLADLDAAEVPAVDVVEAGRVERVVAAEDGHGAEQHRTAYDALVRLTRR